MRADHIPLYRQLVTTLRYRIASGALRPGDRLPALREAGKRWRLSLHTVRRAYQVLSAEGLVEVVPGGATQVTSGNAAHAVPGSRASMQEFVQWMHAESLRRFGVESVRVPGLLALAMEDVPPARYLVVECTATMARRLADQLTAAVGEPVASCTLGELASRREPVVVSTYHHHREVQEIVRLRGAEVHFLTLGVSPTWVDTLERAAASTRRLILTGPEAASLRAMALELRRALGKRVAVESRLSGTPADVIREARGVPVVCTPEAWELLSSEQRQCAGVLLHECEFTTQGIAALVGG